jgi:hypothetical protein
MLVTFAESFVLITLSKDMEKSIFFFYKILAKGHEVKRPCWRGIILKCILVAVEKWTGFV